MLLFYRIVFAILTSLALISTIPAHAQDGKIKVSVTHSGDDEIGKQFVYSVREAIRGSRAFSLALPDDAAIQVRIITVDPNQKNNGVSNWTVATVVYTMTNFIPFKKGDPQTWYPIYLTAQVMTVGQSRTDDQAKSVAASIDASIEKYRRDSKE